MIPFVDEVKGSSSVNMDSCFKKAFKKVTVAVKKIAVGI
jgi:hypothetical protein